ncbi:MAG TPA: dephospho-CoA kinase [Bryobacteraceae bacterium]|nr:dephospho-CoA kinase [Bryobacteraceae bacterium]
MLIAGLTGGMACGKSFVASELRRLGAHTIEADELGHQVLAPGGEAHEAVLKAFGTTDRAELSSRVFGKPEELARLNAIVHPAVRERAAKMVAEIQAADPAAVIVYVAAILFESGGMAGMEKTIVVTCSEEQQLERALERPGATRENVLARLAHQMPMAEKLAKADYVVDTSGTKEDTLRQTKLIFEELRRLAA